MPGPSRPRRMNPMIGPSCAPKRPARSAPMPRPARRPPQRLMKLGLAAAAPAVAGEGVADGLAAAPCVGGVAVFVEAASLVAVGAGRCLPRLPPPPKRRAASASSAARESPMARIAKINLVFIEYLWR